MSDTRRLIEYVLPYRLTLFGAMAAMLIVTAVNLIVPSYAGRLIDRLITTREFGLLNRAVGVMLLMFAVHSTALFAQIYLTYFLSHRIVADIRQDLFARIQRWSLDRVAAWQSGDAISRSLQDTQVIQTEFMTGLVDAISTALTVVGIVGMLLLIDWQLALIIGLVIPVVFGLARAGGREIQGTTARAQAHVAGLAGLIREAFAGARVIRAFTREDREIGRFRQENEQTFVANISIARMVAFQVAAASFFTACGIILVLWFGGQRVTAGSLTVGALIAFLAYVAFAVQPSQSLVRHYAGMRQAVAAFGRVRVLLDEPAQIHERPGAVPMPQMNGRVRFRDVSFAYEPNQWVLRDLNLEVNPGERVALVGLSGAGKTTLVNLIARFYDPATGYVEVDGWDLRRVTTRSLRRQIGLVPQETVLFRGTVRDNIAYARPDASQDEVVAAAKAANAHDFIETMTQGYDTILGDDGMQLSGGQRQRLAIARALLNNPRLLILDEATSALDSESEALIQDAIDRVARGRTTFIIAHRLSTVRSADRIIVLDQGTVVEDGRHDELQSRDGTYARLLRLQVIGPIPADREDSQARRASAASPLTAPA